jgi:Hypothetical protein (DUF2513)
MDLIRELMLRFERDDTSIPEGFTKEQVAYHVRQMRESGLIDAHIISAPSPGKIRPVDFIIHDITPAGHDFIAAIRNEGFWSKVKEEFKKNAAPLTVQLIVSVAKYLAAKSVGIASEHPVPGANPH